MNKYSNNLFETPKISSKPSNFLCRTALGFVDRGAAADLCIEISVKALAVSQ